MNDWMDGWIDGWMDGWVGWWIVTEKHEVRGRTRQSTKQSKYPENISCRYTKAYILRWCLFNVDTNFAKNFEGTEANEHVLPFDSKAKKDKKQNTHFLDRPSSRVTTAFCIAKSYIDWFSPNEMIFFFFSHDTPHHWARGMPDAWPVAS